jgi:hypothetical protein
MRGPVNARDGNGMHWNPTTTRLNPFSQIQLQGAGHHIFAFDEAFHGLSGPVQLSCPLSSLSIDSPIVTAVSEVTYHCEDRGPYGDTHLGFSHFLSTVDRRNKHITRSYAATGYLQPVLKRPNLYILTAATAC